MVDNRTPDAKVEPTHCLQCGDKLAGDRASGHFAPDCCTHCLADKYAGIKGIDR